MSYILDALRKADAERERDPARGIHAQPAAVPQPGARRAPRWTWALAGVAAAAALAVLAWQSAAPRATDASPLPMPAPAAHLAAPVPTGVMPVSAAVEPPAPIVIIKAAPPQRRAAASPVAATASASAAPTPHAAAAPATVAAPATAATAAASASAAPPERIYAVSELPSDVQHQLPKLAISGGVSSDNRAQRMLIVGGQVMFEGAELAPGVVLEQVRAKSAVLRYRGYRYSVAY